MKDVDLGRSLAEDVANSPCDNFLNGSVLPFDIDRHTAPRKRVGISNCLKNQAEG